MNTNISYLISDQNIVINYNGETHIVKRTESLAAKLITAIKDNKLSEIPNLISVAKRIEKQSNGQFTVSNGRVLVNGIEAPQVLSDKIIKFSNEGLPFQPLVKFAEKLQANPSFRAVNELYSFLEKNDMALASDGCFIAYKKVRDDFTDVHTGKFDNHPGQILEMSRNKVDEDLTRHCSRGFHCGNWRYCHEFHAGGHMLEVKVNPADVVSVPNDLNEKIRVCKYEVLGVVNEESSDQLRYQDEEDKRKTEEYDEDVCEHCSSANCAGECLDDYCDNCDELIDNCECEEVDDLCECCETPFFDDEKFCQECGEERDSYPYEDEIE